MQKVSNEYKESMKSSLRERAYMMLSFGVINQEAQVNAKLVNAPTVYFSADDKVFNQTNDPVDYATFDEDYIKVDGSMYFVPEESAGLNYLNDGLVSSDFVSDSEIELTINLNVGTTSLKGLTITFDDNYATDFDIVGSDGTIIEVRDNDTAEYYTEEVIDDITSLTLIFYSTKYSNRRLRIYSILFGFGLTYRNDSIVDSSLESYVSPIGEDVPQIDFSVQLKNYDKYFNVDNPNSVINFLETGQEMDIYYGYQLPNSDTIEWIMGNHLLCSEWESDDYSATIKCQDVFRSMDTEYYKGMYNANSVSFYDLAVAVLADAGETNYYIDSRLKSLYSKNPVPRVETKQALQIIANACRCTLAQTRQGKISIKSNFIPNITASSNGEEYFSNVSNILEDTTKQEYGTFANNYTVVDGGMYFAPEDSSGVTLNTGYISTALSDENCTFSTNPIITLKQSASHSYYGMRLKFGSALPAAFTIRTSNEGEQIEEYAVTDGISQDITIVHTFDEFDVMEIEFTKTELPYNRIVLNYIEVGDITDFTMTRRDMTSSPKAIKQELVKEVTVVCYTYKTTSEESSVVGEDVTVTAGEIETYYISDPCYGYTAYLDESTSGVSIVSSGNYYIQVKFSKSGSYHLEIKGYKYTIVEKYATVSLNEKGKTVKWENPMISDMSMALSLANWLGDYYKSAIEYEYDYRGNPEIDANDIIYQENEFHDDMKVNVYRTTLNFKQAFSGSITARRVGG